jgi:hypothetical protein
MPDHDLDADGVELRTPDGEHRRHPDHEADADPEPRSC